MFPKQQLWPDGRTPWCFDTSLNNRKITNNLCFFFIIRVGTFVGEVLLVYGNFFMHLNQFLKDKMQLNRKCRRHVIDLYIYVHMCVCVCVCVCVCGIAYFHATGFYTWDNNTFNDFHCH